MISEKLVDIKNEVDTQEGLINSIALALDGRSIPEGKEFLSSGYADPSLSTYGGLLVPVDISTLNVGDLLYVEGQNITADANISKAWILYGKSNANIQYFVGIWVRYPENQSSNLGGATLSYDGTNASIKFTASNSWRINTTNEYKLYRVGNVVNNSK